MNKNNVAYEVHFHPATVSVADSNKIINIPGALGCKSLFVKDKKSDRFFMAVLPNDKRADMRNLAHYVGAEKFEFASAEKMLEMTGVARGNVSPFCFLFPGSANAGLLVDKKLSQVPVVRFHPCDNTATVVLSSSDFFRCLALMGKDYILVD